MFQIYSFISDTELQKEFMTNLKNRKIEQKFIYLGLGANNYYSAYGSALDKKNTEVNELGLNASKLQYYNFLTKYLKKGKKTAFISLGCGNSLQEKSLLEKLINNGYDISYFGIDSSKDMLNLALDSFNKSDIDKYKFICADFTNNDFKGELDKMCQGFDNKIFAFLGNTFGQPNQTYIIDSLYNILGEKDLLWVDNLSRVKDLDELDSKNKEMKLFNRYSEYLNSKKLSYFIFSPLEEIGIPFKNGKMMLETEYDNSIGAINFKFSFLFQKKTTISFRGEIIYVLPNEKIELYNIRNYNPSIFINFTKGHNFKFIDRDVSVIKKDWLYENQFLFQKV